MLRKAVDKIGLRSQSLYLVPTRGESNPAPKEQRLEQAKH